LSRYSQLCPVFLAQTFINGELAAFCEGVLCNDGQTLCIARVATKKAYYHYSPGQILFVRAIDEIKNNVRYFDLTRGDEDYKVKLGAKPHANFLFEISGCNHTGKEENTL
jgi:CelD/BcsL family acetyltransferase involved in cellulose biosynthesis